MSPEIDKQQQQREFRAALVVGLVFLLVVTAVAYPVIVLAAIGRTRDKDEDT